LRRPHDAAAAVSLFSGSHGEAGCPPRLHAAIERQRALKSEAAQVAAANVEICPSSQ